LRLNIRMEFRNMFRPGARHLNKIVTHSELSDQEYLIDMEDPSGGREGWHSQLIERYTPTHSGHFNKINRKDCLINREDMNTYGHWDSDGYSRF
jgi:hypothetical protein